MTLYLYKIGTATPVLTIEHAASYTDKQVMTEEGIVYAPLADECELSATADCAGTLRADYRAENPSEQSRMEELEALVAEILFGGEGA